MKKKLIVLLGISLSLSIAASSGKLKQVDKEGTGSAENVSTEEVNDLEPTEELQETEKSSEEEASAQEEETIYNIGEAIALGDWEITVTGMQIVDSVASGEYFEFKPDEEGDKYVQIIATVSNKGKQSDRFLPYLGYGDDVGVKLLYGDGYEFSSTQLIAYEKELHDATINPLSSQEGEIFFEVPETVASSTDEILIRFFSEADRVSIKVR